MKPKIFGHLRSSTTTSTVSTTGQQQQQQKKKQQQQPHKVVTIKSSSGINDKIKTQQKGDSFIISSNSKNNYDTSDHRKQGNGTSTVSWVRHYTTTTPPVSSSSLELNNTNIEQQDALNYTADDTEDSSSQHSMTNNNNVPIVTKSYVYPTTTSTTNTTSVLQQPDEQQHSTEQQHQEQEQQQQQQQTDDTWSTAAPKVASNSSTTNEKNLSDMIWETAEPFLAYSSAQGVKWCTNMNQLSTIFQDCNYSSTKNTTTNFGGSTSLSTKDYDDTLAIVGTQDDEDDDNDEAAANNVKDNSDKSNGNNVVDSCNVTHNMSGISNYCDSTTEMMITTLQQQQQTFLQQCTTQEPLLADKNEVPLVDGKENVFKQQLSSRSLTTASSSTRNKIIISRTHEDIEVSPGHHVQVRLPPVNPILKSPCKASSPSVASRNHMNYSGIATTPKSFVSKLEPAVVRSEGIITKSSFGIDQQKEHPMILPSPSNDSNKAVPTNETPGGVTSKSNIININSSNVASDNIVKLTDGDAATLTTTTSSTMPLMTLEVKSDEAYELLRNISELTMRSSYAATDTTLHKIPENRRMAYYAVGKHHKQSGKGGNRRCYFTGKLILGGAPFYAGSVLQGLRTLVVFCLPSSIGLPDKDTMLLLKLPRSHSILSSRTDSHSTGTGTLKGLRLLKSGTNGSGSKQSSPSYISHYTQRSNNLGASSNVSHAGTATSTVRSGILSNRGGNKSHHRSHSSTNHNINSGISIAGSKSMMSRLSSLDDLSLSVEGDLDPNWSLDRDMLLKVLPPASPELLRTMATMYGEQFETLPVQVRDAKQWKLYVKFCFFSGLPIADGEMHYKVRDDIAEQVYGEEIVLSHDVMEASTGASAEILSLPNRTVMRYLRKHYAQQCSKLDDRVFQRASWVRVAPEV